MQTIIHKLSWKQHQKYLQDLLAGYLLIAAIAAQLLCAWHVTVVKRERYVSDAATDSRAQKKTAEKYTNSNICDVRLDHKSLERCSKCDAIKCRECEID